MPPLIECDSFLVDLGGPCDLGCGQAIIVSFVSLGAKVVGIDILKK